MLGMELRDKVSAYVRERIGKAYPLSSPASPPPHIQPLALARRVALPLLVWVWHSACRSTPAHALAADDGRPTHITVLLAPA